MASQRIRLVKCPKCLKILQEDQDVPVYQCGGCSAILQAKKRNIAPSSTGETERTQASEPETNNVSSSSGQDTVLPSSHDRSLSQECRNASMESMEKQLDELELSNGNETNEIKEQDCSLVDSEKNEVEEEEVGAISGSLSVDHVEEARPSNSSGNAEIITPDASPIGEKQSQIDSPANKTSSAYDGSKSSSDEREDQFLDEDEQWNALQKIRSEKFETQRYPVSYKEKGASSSSTFSEKWRNGNTAYSEWHQNRSLQLEGPGGRLGRQERRHVNEQLRPDMPFYPREPYTRGSPSYPSLDEFDRYSRAHSLQMPLYAGGGMMSQEGVDYMYHNHIRARGRGSRIPFSEEMAGGDRRNRGGWSSGQLHNSYSSYSASPQRPMEQQPEYYPPRWNREIVSDAEEHQRNRRAGHHRQRVAKRHVRPTAGGAPFVSCYRCSEHLQLPVDFLIFKRKHHLLRCGTCTSVLRFSLQSGTHLVPVIVTHDIDANRNSNSTSESPRDDKAPSSKSVKVRFSVQDEEVHVSRGSPLHRLMGYTTVSQVFKASQRPPSV